MADSMIPRWLASPSLALAAVLVLAGLACDDKRAPAKGDDTAAKAEAGRGDGTAPVEPTPAAEADADPGQAGEDAQAGEDPAPGEDAAPVEDDGSAATGAEASGEDPKPDPEAKPDAEAEPGKALRVAKATTSMAPKGSKQTGLRVESRGGGRLAVSIEGFGWYCTPKPEFTFGRVRQQLVLRPKAPSGAVSRCVGQWKVQLELEGVDPGSYELVVYREATGRAVHLRAGVTVDAE